MKVDIAIAGGSHAGLAVALALAGTFHGEISVALIERRDMAVNRLTAADPRAFALSAGSVALLTALGVWDRVKEHAQPVAEIEITDSALDNVVRPALLTYDNHLPSGEPATYILESERLLTALQAQIVTAPGLYILAPAEIATVERTAATPAGITLADGRTVTASLIVAADGARSMLRDGAGIKSSTWSYGQTGIVTTIAHERPHHGRAVQHFLPAGPFAILPLTGGRSCITWSEEAGNAQRILALEDDAFLVEVERRFGHRLGALKLDGPRASWPLAMRLSRSLIAPRLALVGDAARSVHPIAGQGLNLGLRDVAALTEVVAQSLRLGLEPGDMHGLERYERWRRFDGQSSAAAYDALNRLFSNESSMLRVIRDAGLGIVDRMPGLKHLLVREAAGLTGEVPRLLEGAFP